MTAVTTETEYDWGAFMDDEMERSGRDGKKRGVFNLPANVVLIGFLVIAGFYLITEHRAHLYGWLPWLLLFAAGFLHLFLHGRHGGHSRNGHADDGSSQ